MLMWVLMGRWAQLDAGQDEPEQGLQVHKMAMNVGRRPSIEDGTDMTVEVHILHTFQTFNFRGKHLRVIGTGYIRSSTSSILKPWETYAHGVNPACLHCATLGRTSDQSQHRAAGVDRSSFVLVELVKVSG